LLLGAAQTTCAPSETESASAYQVTHREQLVGGDRALGDVGDFLLENDKIRLVVQAPGFSRGFGVYGGSLLDADLRRPNEVGHSGAGVGHDNFAELFPSFFVQAVAVNDVHVLSDGSDGGPAQVEAVGTAGDFLELAAYLNRAVTSSHDNFTNRDSDPILEYRTIYELHPGKRYVTLRFRVTHKCDEDPKTSFVTCEGRKALAFPDKGAETVLKGLGLTTEGFTVPLGDIALFGSTSKVFIPGIGFDLRFGLEAAYDRKVDWPAFPGFPGEFIASRGDHTSYGMIVEPSDDNYVFGKKAIYDDGRTPITKSSLFFPFVANAFVGVFHHNAPETLEPNASFEVVKHFIVGSGDVGSVLDTILEIRGVAVGALGGQVFDRFSGAPAKGTSVLVYQRPASGERRILSQYDVREGGFFGGSLEPGDYSLRVQGAARPLGDLVDFSITAGQTTGVRVDSDPPGRVLVRALSPAGTRLPAKATAVGRYGSEASGKPARTFLFDLQAGEGWRSSDFVTDDAKDENTRRYIEEVAFAEDGVAELLVRPGTYDIVSSRGPEYDTQTTRVTVGAGRTESVTHVLSRVMDTTGWISGDTHVHTLNSIDAGMGLDDRVRSLAAEGVEWAVSTDHNFVTDFAPYIARNDLTEWVRPMIGVELTTLESGHYNAYPLEYQVGPITHGSPNWALEPPDEIFTRLRAMGRLEPSRTIVQVNHPRDGLLGYFGQYSRHAYTHEKIPPSGASGTFTTLEGPAFIGPAGEDTYSYGYDALELGVSKNFYQVHHYRVPGVLPTGQLPAVIPPAGSILTAEDGDAAFPGVVDDWFNLLNLGYRFIGVGTGDSHDAADEPGQFRSLVFVGADDPQTLTEERIISALQSRRVVVTNGPLVDFYVEDPVRGVMGQELDDAGKDGKVALHYEVKSPSWMGVGRINIYRNGTIAKAVDVPVGSKNPLSGDVELELGKDKDGAAIDSWFVVEAIGYDNAFPVIRPLELPPIMLTDALATLAGPLGLGSDEWGVLRPPPVFPVTAYAITNPVWVKSDEGDWDAPGLVPIEVQNLAANDPHFQEGIYAPPEMMTLRRVVAESRMGDRRDLGRKVPLFHPRRDNPFDVRKTLSRFGHLNGHQ
jgi:hypothetical protein